MRIQDLDEGVGRIIKGVNTTQDVGVDQTKIEAAKFGNSVDKDGRPPTMSSAVKGKSTNVLFNLGLTEGIKLKLERDKHIDVLHITDTNNKHRIEVRGKKGYESGGYDRQDKLHQVLDRVGKAANISELMNGEVVSINPNHPQGSRAIRTAKDVLQTESSHSIMKQAIIEGGHSLDDLDKPTPTIAELVKMHGVPAKQILKQLEMGIEAEYEHTSDFEVAKQIAMDHIAEDPAYYDKLKFIESPRPRMSPADIAADTRASSTGVSQAELQRLTSQYRSQPPNAIASLLNSLDVDTVIGIALAIGAPHLSFLQRFLIKRGIRFSRNVMQRAMAQVESMTEAFDTDVEWIKGAAPQGASVFAAKVDDAYIEITYKPMNKGVYISFTRGARMSVTGEGSQNKIFGAVINHIKKWVDANKPQEIYFSAFKPRTGAFGSQDETRSGLYRKMVQRFASQNGYDYDVEDTGNEDTFILKRQENDTQTNEALDQPYPVRWSIQDDDEWEGKAKTEAGDSIQIMITQGFNNHKWEVDFYVGGSMQVTGKGDQFRVFATVVSAVKEWWSWLSKSKQPVEAIIFSAFKGNEDTKGSAGRSSLYNRFANQFARSIGFEVSTIDGSDNIKFMLANPNYKDQQTENFADGKKKGKSRPGRVKRAGASCNGSVTALRKRAKNASGEKAKMYHWCANMKSGKKK